MNVEKENIGVQNAAQSLGLEVYVITQFLILTIIYIMLGVYGMDIKYYA